MVKRKKLKKVKLRLRKPTKEKPTLLNFKVTKADLRAITAKARRFTGGNMSFWLRHASLHYVPKRKDLSP